jgi:hypothetical protein
MIFMKKGWIENRRGEREKTTTLVDYRIIPSNMRTAMQDDANYSKTHVKGSEMSATVAHLFQVTPDQLMHHAVLFCTQDPLQDGWWLELSLKVPKWEERVRFLVQVMSVRPENEMKEVIFTANLQVFAAHKGDLQKLTDIIRGSKF